MEGDVPLYVLFFIPPASWMAKPLRLTERANKVFPQVLVMVKSIRIDIVRTLSSLLNKRPLPAIVSARRGSEFLSPRLCRTGVGCVLDADNRDVAVCGSWCCTTFTCCFSCLFVLFCLVLFSVYFACDHGRIRTNLYHPTI